jgi:hypothetical protein
MEDNIVLTTNELQILSELDARQFGFVKLTEEQHVAKKSAALKAIQGSSNVTRILTHSTHKL